MQRYKTIVSLLSVVCISWCLCGCAYIYKEKYKINYNIVIVELSHNGKAAKTWKPVPGTVYTYIDDDVVIFTDSVTGERQKISGSYKFIKK